MKLVYSWLGDYLDLRGVTPQQAADTLTRVGVEVESVNVIDYSEILVGRILTWRPHPESRNPLWIHEVDVGGETRTIIAGAPNAVEGSVVPVALPGTTVPSGKLVRDIVIAGVPAKGMLCSAEELLRCEASEPAIMLLDSGTPGQSLAELYPTDAILEAEITSNRPDCLGHLGVARELAAALNRPLNSDFMPVFLGEAEPAGTEFVKVTIEDPDLCRRYIGAVIRGVEVGPSPEWLQTRLCRAGVRPISNIVDITNYVLLEYGQPLHAFDLAKLAGPEIRVRRARAGERLLCLDGEERELAAEMLVIADAERPVALAGVIGGEESAVGAGTRDILLESATFDGPNVRSTMRATGLRTEASSRFEKGLAPELALAGARRAAALLSELAGGQVHREWPDEYPRPQEPVRVHVHPEKVDAVLGAHVPLEEGEAILRRLGFHVRVQEDGAWDVLPPVWRLDVGIPEDIAEEVGRHYGYDKVEATLPGARRTELNPAPPSRDRRLDAVREVLTGAGVSESITPALVPWRELEELDLGRRAMRVSNALSDEMNALRTSLLPSLLHNLERNRNRGQAGAFFELAKVYLAKDGSGDLPDEPLRLGAILPTGPDASDGRTALLRMKSMLDASVRALGAPPVTYRPGRHHLFHPGRCAEVLLGEAVLGHLGELHPTVTGRHDLPGRAAAIEIDAEPLLEAASVAKAQPLPRFPAVTRELNVVVEDDQAATEVMATAAAAGGELLDEVRVVDEYHGAQVGEGRKSLNLALTFRSPERTLTDPEVDSLLGEIRSALERRFSAGFRT